MAFAGLMPSVVVIDETTTFFTSLDEARQRFNEWCLTNNAFPVKVALGVDDKTAAVAAFIEHGGKPYEIFSIEKAFLGELVEYEECLEEFYTEASEA